VLVIRKILLLSVSAGAGHVRAAEALRVAAGHYGEDIEALHLDVMDYVPKSFRKLYANLYERLVNRHPQLWGMLYRISSDAEPKALVQRLRRVVERMNTRALHKAVIAFAPDAIVCTHFLPAEMLMHEIKRERVSVPVWVQVTDFDLHRMWVIPRMTGYFAANDEIGFRMRASGLPATGVHVTGIPIMPAFAEAPDRQACATEFGLDADRPIFLLMGGGAGVGKLDEVAASLLGAPGDFQLVVLAGRNVKSLERLEAMRGDYPSRLFPLGYCNRVERLMACADLAITKPGGLTTSECLAMGLPMIVNAPIPGQEERNADFLLEQGAALKAVDAVGLTWRLGQLAADPGRLATMRQRAGTLGRPHAARDVLDIVLADLAGRP
jgi:processive 1,2-diacylglycerol beta-glucosyltransferase